MSEEIKTTEEKKCFCQSDFFKKFASIALGTFVGGFCAISLFSALNKPPMIPPMPMMYGGGFHHQIMMNHKHDCKCPCHKKMMKKHFEKKAEFYKKIKEEKKNLGDKE